MAYTEDTQATVSIHTNKVKPMFPAEQRNRECATHKDEGMCHKDCT